MMQKNKKIGINSLFFRVVIRIKKMAGNISNAYGFLQEYHSDSSLLRLVL